jgi:hypothetical protein
LPRPRGRRVLGILAIAGATASLATAFAAAEVTATHDAIIKFDSTMFPRDLPRTSTAPVGIRIEGHIKARNSNREPPALTTIELAIHRAADLSRNGLPVCDISQIDPASSAQALQACPGSHIGYGEIRAESKLPGTEHLHFHGRVTIFNGELANGRPAILLHVFNPTLHSSFVFPLTISHRKGRYGTILATHVRVDRWSSITDFRLVLNRTYSDHGKRTGFLNASCPAPQGLSLGIAPFVVATLKFSDGTERIIPVVGSCRVSG